MPVTISNNKRFANLPLELQDYYLAVDGEIIIGKTTGHIFTKAGGKLYSKTLDLQNYIDMMRVGSTNLIPNSANYNSLMSDCWSGVNFNPPLTDNVSVGSQRDFISDGEVTIDLDNILPLFISLIYSNTFLTSMYSDQNAINASGSVNIKNITSGTAPTVQTTDNTSTGETIYSASSSQSSITVDTFGTQSTLIFNPLNACFSFMAYSSVATTCTLGLEFTDSSGDTYSTSNTFSIPESTEMCKYECVLMLPTIPSGTNLVSGQITLSFSNSATVTFNYAQLEPGATSSTYKHCFLDYFDYINNIDKDLQQSIQNMGKDILGQSGSNTNKALEAALENYLQVNPVSASYSYNSVDDNNVYEPTNDRGNNRDYVDNSSLQAIVYHYPYVSPAIGTDDYGYFSINIPINTDLSLSDLGDSFNFGMAVEITSSCGGYPAQTDTLVFNSSAKGTINGTWFSTSYAWGILVTNQDNNLIISIGYDPDNVDSSLSTMSMNLNNIIVTVKTMEITIDTADITEDIMSDLIDWSEAYLDFGVIDKTSSYNYKSNGNLNASMLNGYAFDYFAPRSISSSTPYGNYGVFFPKNASGYIFCENSSSGVLNIGTNTDFTGTGLYYDSSTHTVSYMYENVELYSMVLDKYVESKMVTSMITGNESITGDFMVQNVMSVYTSPFPYNATDITKLGSGTLPFISLGNKMFIGGYNLLWSDCSIYDNLSSWVSSSDTASIKYSGSYLSISDTISDSDTFTNIKSFNCVVSGSTYYYNLYFNTSSSCSLKLQVVSASDNSKIIYTSDAVTLSTGYQVVCESFIPTTTETVQFQFIISTTESEDVSIDLYKSELISSISNTDVLLKGDLSIGGDITQTNGNINTSGNVYANRCYNPVYCDYAEFFRRGKDFINKGQIVMLSPYDIEERYVLADKRYGNMIVGVCSDEYAMAIGGPKNIKERDMYWIPVALAGRVHVQVVGKVEKGDLITISNIKGIGKSIGKRNWFRKPVIGKALESSDKKGIKYIRILIKNS